jgi:integrase
MILSLASSSASTAGICGTRPNWWLGWIGERVVQQQQNARLGTAHKGGCGMAQSGYLFLEHGKWKVRYRIKGETGKWRWAPVHVLGTKRDFPKRSEAKIAKAEFMANQNKIGFRPETAVNIVDFVETVYHPAIETSGMYFLQDSTRKGYLDIWTKHLKKRLQGKLLRTFRPADAEAVMADLNQRHGNALAHGTYSNLKTAFSAIFTHAVRTGVINANLVSKVSIPQGRPVGRVCEAYTLQDIFHHLNLLNGKPQAKAIVALVAFGGLRKGELRGLMSADDRGENIAIHRSVWHNVVKEQCKTTSSGTELAPAMIPVIGPLRTILDAIKPFESGWMFPNRRGGVLDLDNLATRVVKPLLKKASLPWHGWQAYRRGLASNLKALGIDDMVIQRILRHDDVSTTQNYIHVRDERMLDAMRQLGLAFDACTAFVQAESTTRRVN